MPQHAGSETDNIIIGTWDLSDVLPPVSVLRQHAAAYHFSRGYTAKLGSTQMGD